MSATTPTGAEGTGAPAARAPGAKAAAEEGGKPRLVLFDLDHTLLTGDSDVLWCDWLVAQGLLDAREFSARNADMEARYKAGTVGVMEFAEFYVGTLAGRSVASWEPVRQAFLRREVLPRIPFQARALVANHLADGDLVVMTTATNRFLTELTAEALGVQHLLATECEVVEGVFTGRTEGTLNMRQGKVVRLHEWLRQRGEALEQYHSIAYSDSINDLPLLEAVDEPVAVDPDPRLEDIATNRRWPVLRLARQRG
jgi:HAD superfamily hydrolase (TIGR01490 family)